LLSYEWLLLSTFDFTLPLSISQIMFARNLILCSYILQAQLFSIYAPVYPFSPLYCHHILFYLKYLILSLLLPLLRRSDIHTYHFTLLFFDTLACMHTCICVHISPMNYSLFYFLVSLVSLVKPVMLINIVLCPS
ncbi:hypothetical protein J3Q64DRAFT_1716430, partial [Phycomyces blakesleeanus]